MTMLKNLSVGRKLYGAFALVAALFTIALAITLVLERSAQSAWNHTRVWDRAVTGSQTQIKGTRQQMAAQALYVATFDPKYKAQWEQGVELGNRGTTAVQALGNKSIAAIANGANTADHHHDDAVHSLLFPAVARGDHKAALAALEQADTFVRIPLAAQEKIAGRIQELRAADIRHAESLQSKAETVGIVLAVLAVLFAALAAFLITRAIRRPLAVVTAAAERIAVGDLSVDVQVDGKDELGQLARSFQSMVESVRSMVGEVAEAANLLSSSSIEMASTAEEAGRAVTEIATSVGSVAEGAERQVRVVVEAKNATEEMAQAAQLGASNAEETASAARDARTASEAGVIAVQSASDAMKAVHESSVAVTEAIQTLGAKSEQIGGIVRTITGIAGQTNLLALNAAIEAARAGEQGRGFAVVAEEVRKLAEESQLAAASIASLVDEIQAETHRTVAVVETGAKRTEDGVAVVEHAREAFLRIGASVEDMSGRVDQIVVAIAQFADSSQRMRSDIEEVAVVAEQSSAATEQVSASTEQTSASTQQIAASAQSLSTTAEVLQELVAQFKLAA